MRETNEKESRFLRLIEDNRRLVSKVCFMYAVDSAHFDDLYQETMLNLWRGLDTFRGDSAPSTWIYRMAINTCLTDFRRLKNRPSAMPAEALPELNDPLSDRPEQLREMYRLIGQLGEVDKAIVMMWLDELSYDEIAEATGFPRNTVATRLRRAKARLVEAGNS
ncbi:MAG: sigma-70 family RNA polymerase sigma factor [Bacteroidales bacterium]|nr:sigma-70 family RNA polymerase sigma factor [Bacteroidales bacterium]MCD8393943.1 sigma-70 family RNA polymerase sigma factor [Bacteroidales bacterium]